MGQDISADIITYYILPYYFILFSLLNYIIYAKDIIQDVVFLSINRIDFIFLTLKIPIFMEFLANFAQKFK